MAHLLPMFKELTHFQSELNRYGSQQEAEMFEILDLCEQLRQKWQASEVELAGLKRITVSYENDLAQCRVENKQLKAELLESRSTVGGLIAARTELERERDILTAQVEMARSVLREEANQLPEFCRRKLQFLDTDHRPAAIVIPRNQSCSALGDISYDKTEESLDMGDNEEPVQHHNVVTDSGSRGKRSINLTRLVPTAPSCQEIDDGTPRKRSKDDTHIGTGNNHLAPLDYQTVGYRSPLNRSFSEPHNVGVGLLQPPGSRMKSVADLATLSPATAVGTGRRHTFLSKTSVRAEYCDHCEKRMQFASTVWRCEVCKMLCHADCRELALLPCVARGTPSTRSQKGKLVDFVPREPPMVPNVIVHCINEMERRGLTSMGLYRVSGSDIQVQELLDKFLFGRGIPNLRQVEDINTLASCVKKFLSQLSEPIIPPTSWQEFVRAGSMKMQGQDATMVLHHSISDLPQPNRDTLAFLIIHLQKVIEYSSQNKMTLSNVAKIFGPTVVGTTSVVNLDNFAEHTSKLEAVMTGLLELPPDYWGRFLCKESAPLMGAMAAASTSPLFYEQENNAQDNIFGRCGTGTIPKSSGYRTRNNRKKFFNAPWK